MSGPYLIPSNKAADKGEKIGINPSFLSKRELDELGVPSSPLKAIRAHCIECGGDSYAEANKCTATGCNLWPYRMGKNPFDKRAKRNSLELTKAKPATAATARASNSNSTAIKNEDRNVGNT